VASAAVPTFLTLLSFKPFPSTATFPNEMFSLGICSTVRAAAAAADDAEADDNGKEKGLSVRCFSKDAPSSFAFSV
jgi:hypothetical protein